MPITCNLQDIEAELKLGTLREAILYAVGANIEKRKVWTVPVSSLPCLHNQSLWTGLTTIVMVVSERQMWNKTTNEVRFYLSSLESNAEKIA